ncbi:hypothetical protein TpMuguga_04g00186 [Theileria parva strain Muguga]|uniref:CBF1-interacting co-repressor CIR N-terminal domain-containing protein n=1 Tax=Theileria parva TaxID=5875 RepID=Q4N120_THEPA|nr:uncharacterized protein TpMuguga_04g00186 [Theileria parva strain Muguga]EAN31538.1 hypothetical protein TpMuguga_04g00186 [Theileria parva strain Muguga]|eukprot:XP_763821.1 hypothetical protein [Theileria parva strain Muguga]
MGGHGGLNILPQKKWNVYRHDRQYQVKFDEHRDIEKKLNDKEKLKRERLSDSLVELRRRAQDTQNRDVDVETELKVEDRSGFKVKRLKRDKNKHKDKGDEFKSEKSDLFPELNEDIKKEDGKKKTGHINFFEKEEREAEEASIRRREHLIKSGHYIYNSDFKGPRKVNVYVDEENAKVTPDFKKQQTPWYMKPKPPDSNDFNEVSYTEYSQLGRESKNKQRKTKEELRSERLSRESSERERALALLKSK